MRTVLDILQSIMLNIAKDNPDRRNQRPALSAIDFWKPIVRHIVLHMRQLMEPNLISPVHGQSRVMHSCISLKQEKRKFDLVTHEEILVRYCK